MDILGGLGRDSSGGAAVLTTSRMGYTRASSTTASPLAFLNPTTCFFVFERASEDAGAVTFKGLEERYLANFEEHYEQVCRISSSLPVFIC